MQKKNKKIGKRITALAMCVVLLATSMPFMIASAAGSYNPIPTWPAERENRGVSAYTNAEGDITVDFPAATANTTYRTGKTVTGYLLELVDLGLYDSAHTEVLILNKFVTPAGTAPYEAEITAEEIAAKLPDGLDENHRYNVTITAVDSDGWFSDELNTIVSDIPKFNYDAEVYSPILDFDHAMREMMTFESNPNGAAVGIATGGQLQIGGAENQTGAIDPNSATDMDSQGMRLRIIGEPTQQQTFDTAYSRQTWDFSQAEEVWFWLDLRQVDLTGLSFRLRTNEKWWTGWADKTVNSDYKVDGISDAFGTVYSTSGYTGTDAYVYVQRADGGWEKQYLNADGTLDIGHFEGYVRVPLQFFCSETATTVNATNEKFKDSGDKSEAYANSLKLAAPVTVDEAGTCITDALLLQNRCYSYTSGIFGLTKNQFPVGTMLAAGISVPTATDERRATVNADGTINRPENSYKAIEDLYAAGIAFTGCSADSVEKSLFLDNILFYKENDDPYPENTLNSVANTGNTVDTYFDQTKEIPRAIFTACETYFNDPNWSDYRAVAYIESLIAGYKRAYGEAGVNTDFLEEANLTATAATLGMESSWNLFLDARQKCQEADTYAKDNNEADDLVPKLEQELEKMPDPTTMYSMSDEMKAEVERLHKIYGKLNLAQLDSLGDKAEARLLSYFTYLKDTLQDNIMPVGQVLTNNPFIPFATFENESLGTRAWQLENDVLFDSVRSGNGYTDYRYTKGLLTYMPSNYEGFAGKTKDTINTVLLLNTKQPTKDGMPADTILQQTGCWANITENGFQGSHGATVTLDCQRYSDGEGLYSVFSTTYDSQNGESVDALRAAGTGRSTVQLGDLAKSSSGSSPNPPLCLVFYADFSHLSDFHMSVSISTFFDGTLNDFTVAMGTSASDQKFFLLDPNNGQWVQCQNTGYMSAFFSAAGADTNGDGTIDLQLKNYKGFIMIPLYHFKPGNNSQKLDESALALNNIWRVSIGVAPGSDAGAVEMDGKTYTIDNIGFSYDPTFYTEGVASRAAAGVVDKNFDEIFEAKALPAEQFEKAVTAIDPYAGRNSGDTTFSTAVANARTMYNSLNEYQKTRESVIKANELLTKYESWVADTSLIPTPAITYSEMNTAISRLPDAAKNAAVTGDDDLPYPGLLYDDTTKTYSVNYAAYGFTQETCHDTISLYQDSYKYFTSGEKTFLTNKNQLINAYNAAKRCENLENMLNDLQLYRADLAALYINLQEDPVAGDGSQVNFVSTDAAGIEKLQTLDAKYNSLDYFAKILLREGQFGSNLSNAPSAVSRVLKNAKTYTLTDDTTLVGGIPTTVQRYTTLINATKAKLTARELFTDTELQDLQSTIEGYKNMLSAYYNVSEMNAKIAELLALFDVHETAISSAEIALNETTLSGTSTYQITYSERYPIPAAGEECYIAFTAENGTMQCGAKTLDYKVDITVASTTKTYTSAQLLAGIPAAEAKSAFAVANNTYTSTNPFGAEIKAYLDAAPTGAAGSYVDTVYATLVDKDGNAVLDASDQPIQKAVQVKYAGADTYTVTYPAEISVDWDDSSAKDVSYTVTSNLQTGAALSVSVTNDGTAKMNAVGTDATLTYTATNFGTAQTFTGTNTAVQPNDKPTVAVSGFASAPVGSYKTTLTYTVSYTAAP